MFRAAGVRGRKVPPRGPSVPCEGHHSPSVSVVCGHPAALRSSAAGSLSLRKPGSRTSRQPRLLRSAPRYGFAVVIPGRYSSRPCVFSALRAVLASLRAVLGSKATKPSGQPGCSRSGCWHRLCQNKSATDCAGGLEEGSIRCRERCTSIGQVSRSGSGRGGRLLPRFVGLFRCSREPEVSLPRRSRARRPHTQDRLPGHAPLRSAPYGTARLLAATRTTLAQRPGG